MKRRFSLLLAMVLAMTMVMGMSLTAFADGANPFMGKTLEPWGVNLGSGDMSFDEAIVAFPEESEDINYYKQCRLTFLDNENFKFTTLNDSATGKYSVDNVEVRGYYLNTGTGEYDNLAFGGNVNRIVFAEFLIFKSETPASDPVQNTSSSHAHEWIEGEIYAATQTTDGLEGTYCKTCGAIKESHPISAYVYSLNDYATPMINAAKSGQTITFEFGEWNSFPKSFMAKLVDKSAQNVTFVFKYKWNHKLQTITIPAGTPIDLNFDWYGPAKMAELYGAN